MWGPSAAPAIFCRVHGLRKEGFRLWHCPSLGGSGERRFSRIVAQLGGPVSTSRSDAAIIVTEHGAADLRGLSLSQRRSAC